MESTPFHVENHRVQVCVVGGGLAGLCAAVASARRGARTLLMHDRPVLGGNASSEIRMWVCGAHGRDRRETGIIEEILLKNQFLNPGKNYSLWDSVLYGMCTRQERLETLLNCACVQGEMADGCLHNVTGFQPTTQVWHRVEAELFIDCSGDSVLAPITGAPCRMGREGYDEYGESFAPEQADNKTMGISCLIQARREREESVFIPPKWAKRKNRADLDPHRLPNLDDPMENFWYLELGGEEDCIRDAERIKDELIAEALGLWDYLKNAPENREKNRLWRLDWIGFLPGKRESRRDLGGYVMTVHDVLSGGHFVDFIAYGGWSMDDHHPAGLRTHEPPTTYHDSPSPFGIAYRCLYSAAVPNLMFAGRNISVTHSALSATRVMATCATLGQAAGTAAALAVKDGIGPREVYALHIDRLRQALMEDDCYLPYARRAIPLCSQQGTYRLAERDASILKNGLDRPIDGEDNGLFVPLGSAIEVDFPFERKVSGIRLIFDSDLNRETLPETARGLRRPMPGNRITGQPDSCVPATLVRAFRVEALTSVGWRTLLLEENNYLRLFTAHLCTSTRALRITPLTTWGSQAAHIFSLDVL